MKNKISKLYWSPDCRIGLLELANKINELVSAVNELTVLTEPAKAEKIAKLKEELAALEGLNK